MAEKMIEKFFAREVLLNEQEQGGAVRLPLAWTIREALCQMGILRHQQLHGALRIIHPF